jgi:hypothetical protein
MLNGQEVGGITVKVNSKACQVTQIQADPHPTFRWDYLNSSDPIDPGAGPGVFNITVQYYYGGQAIPADHGGVQTGTFWVYKVEYKDSRNFGERATEDTVRTASNLVMWTAGTQFSCDTVIAVVLDNIGSLPARTIVSYFKVTAPPQCGGYLSDVRVGIAQTLTEASTLGSVTYSRTTNNIPLNPNTGTYSQDFINPLNPFPYFDGPESGMRYYVYQDGPSNATMSGGTYIWNGGQFPLVLDDSPYDGMPSQTWPLTPDPVYGTDTYQWGTPSGYFRYRGGTNRVNTFEDVLCASCSMCPGVYVPIKAFQSWTVTFAGYLDSSPPLSASIWQGGSITGSAGALSKPESVRGIANEMLKLKFTAP